MKLKTRTNQPVYNAETGEVASILTDGEIIKNIEVTYNEEDEITDFKFPKGIMPLSITLNSHALFFRGSGYLVDGNGNAIEGYSIDDYWFDDGDGCLHLTINGEHDEEVINEFTYLKFDSTNTLATDPDLIYNSFSLFFPQVLYKHTITVHEDTYAGSDITLIVIDKEENKISLAKIWERIEKSIKATWSYQDDIFNFMYGGADSGDFMRITKSTGSMEMVNDVNFSGTITDVVSVY